MLTKDTVEKVSKLARLKLTEAEVEALAKDLSAVLENFEKIAKLDTSGVEPLVTPSDVVPSLRPDERAESDNSDKMLENAPERSGRLFRVPPVV